VRSGDVNISGTGAEALTTREAIVSADAGKITVTGEIIATAPKNSRVGLFAGNGVTLESTAILKANSTKAGEEGGKVEVNTLANQLDFKAGSSIDVSGGVGGAGGEVTMRAPRTADNKDINIAEMSTTITGAKKIQAEGFKVYNKTAITTADQSKVLATGFYKEAESFMKSVIANNAYGLGRLGITSDSMFTIVPGVEVINSAGSLTVSNDWSFHDWRFDPTTGAGVTTPAQLASGLNADGGTLSTGFNTTRLW
jgi:adhesin HecA-like repeat protein